MARSFWGEGMWVVSGNYICKTNTASWGVPQFPKICSENNVEINNCQYSVSVKPKKIYIYKTVDKRRNRNILKLANGINLLSCREVIGGYRIQLSFKMMKVFFEQRKFLEDFFSRICPKLLNIFIVGKTSHPYLFRRQFIISLYVFVERFQFLKIIFSLRECHSDCEGRKGVWGLRGPRFGSLETPSGCKGPVSQRPQ